MRERMLAALLACSACATGTPVGGRSLGAAVGRHRFTPAALPRALAPANCSPLGSTPGGSRERALEVARSLLERKGARAGPSGDCAGLVRAAFEPLGIDVMSCARPGDNAVTAIYRFASARGRLYEGGWPVAGDLVFFRETYDQNRDGRVNDGLTHVGLVDSVAGDGTVEVIHRVQRGVVRTRMNLQHPGLHRRPGTAEVLNDYLRPSGASRAALTGELFASYATVL